MSNLYSNDIDTSVIAVITLLLLLLLLLLVYNLRLSIGISRQMDKESNRIIINCQILIKSPAGTSVPHSTSTIVNLL
jgi:hypothetical protein